MRVLVCRPRADGEATAARLIAAGHEAVVAPVMTIEGRPVILPAQAIDATVVTSRHALWALDEDAVAALLHQPLYAVGGATARAARTRGFEDVRIGQGDAASLAALLALTLKPGAHLLYLAGAVHKDDLPDSLVRGGYAVTIRETYTALAGPPWPPAIGVRLRAGALDACLHFSRRSAELALDASVEAGAEDAFGALHHRCLSADAAGPILARGYRTSVAERPSEDSLLQGLSLTLR